jgi:hypothetical protein
MDFFRVLILVLASDTDPIYCKFQTAWRQASHPRADILFLKAHPNVRGEDFLHETTVYIGCPETLETVYEKQMRAFKLLRPILGNYAFVFRTNLSSFVDIPKYLEFCTTLPRSGVYSGVVGHDAGTSFASGSGFTITPDLIHRLVEENPPEVLVDDVSIGAAMQSWGIPIVPAPRVDRTSDGGWILHSSPHSTILFHRRIKTDNRETDCALLSSLFENSKTVVSNKSLTKRPFWMIR